MVDHFDDVVEVVRELGHVDPALDKLSAPIHIEKVSSVHFGPQ